jgi:hypothetical protein
MTQQITRKSWLFLVVFIISMTITTTTIEGETNLLAAPSILSIFNTVPPSMPAISVQFVT